jgi:threonine/homoserine/homoserine lactone efflux protein
VKILLAVALIALLWLGFELWRAPVVKNDDERRRP